MKTWIAAMTASALASMVLLAACGTDDAAPSPVAVVTPTPIPSPTPTPDCGLTFVPFEKIHSISAPTLNGDRIVVGEMTAANFERLLQLRPPSTVNEVFCRDVTLGPSYVGRAYIPTESEKRGDFSHVPTPIFDPLTGVPFPNNQIPRSLLPAVAGWRIPR